MHVLSQVYIKETTIFFSGLV